MNFVGSISRVRIGVQVSLTMNLWFIFLTIHEINYNVSRGKKQNRTKKSHKHSEKYHITEGEIGKTKYKKRGQSTQEDRQQNTQYIYYVRQSNNKKY